MQGTPSLAEEMPGTVATRRQYRGAALLTAALLLWMLYMATGFRLPTQPIEVSDANASAIYRQVTFAGAGLLAMAILYFRQALGSLLAARLPFALFAAYLASSIVWSENPALTVKRAAVFAFGVIAQIGIVHISRRPIAGMLSSVVAFCSLAAVLSILLHLALPAPYTVNPARPGLAGISNHPNTFAPFLSIGLTLSLGITLAKRRDRRLLLFGQAAMAIALALTHSVTAWASTIACLALYCFLIAKPYQRGIIQILTVAGTLLIFAAGWSNVKSSLFEASGRDESLSGRDQLWAVVWEKASEHSLIGRGFGAFWTEGKGRELVQTWNPRQSHHAYLDVYVDLGATGLLATLALFHLSILMAWPRTKGPKSSAQRRAVAALVAVSLGYAVSYAMSQSYLLRFDTFPFFVLVWTTLLLTNSGKNRIECEFAQQT